MHDSNVTVSLRSVRVGVDGRELRVRCRGVRLGVRCADARERRSDPLRALDSARGGAGKCVCCSVADGRRYPPDDEARLVSWSDGADFIAAAFSNMVDVGEGALLLGNDGGRGSANTRSVKDGSGSSTRFCSGCRSGRRWRGCCGRELETFNV